MFQKMRRKGWGSLFLLRTSTERGRCQPMDVCGHEGGVQNLEKAADVLCERPLTAAQSGKVYANIRRSKIDVGYAKQQRMFLVLEEANTMNLRSD